MKFANQRKKDSNKSVNRLHEDITVTRVRSGRNIPDLDQLKKGASKMEYVGPEAMVYAHKDGSHTAAFGNGPLHFQNEEGEIQKVENYLICEKMDCPCASLIGERDGIEKREYYHNKNNDFWAFFPERLTKDVLTVKRGAYVLSFMLPDARDMKALGLDDQSERYKPHFLGQRAEVISGRNDCLRYSDFDEDSDLEYVMRDNGVKENIVLKNRREEYRFVFLAQVNGLAMTLMDDGSVIVGSEADPVFVIPAPIMYDATGKNSQDLAYKIEPIEEHSGCYLFEIEASADWINATERVFPVVLDPQVYVYNALSASEYLITVTPVLKQNAGTTVVPPSDGDCTTSGGNTSCNNSTGDCSGDHGGDCSTSGDCSGSCGDDCDASGDCSGGCDGNCDTSCEGTDCDCCVCAFSDGDGYDSSDSIGSTVCIQGGDDVMACEDDYNEGYYGGSSCDCDGNNNGDYSGGNSDVGNSNVSATSYTLYNNGTSSQELHMTIKNPRVLPKFKKCNIRVTCATLSWGIDGGNPPVHVLVKLGDRVIENYVYESGESGLALDVTNVMNHLIQTGEESAELVFQAASVATAGNYVAFRSVGGGISLLMDYISADTADQAGKSLDFNVGQAGRGRIELDTGKVSFTYTDAATGSALLPIPISHVYNGRNRSWNLNIRQTLSESVADEEYIYTDGNGETHLFEKRAYYIEDGTKHFVEVNGMSAGASKQEYVNLKYRTVYCDLMTENGLILRIDRDKRKYLDVASYSRYYAQDGKVVETGATKDTLEYSYYYADGVDIPVHPTHVIYDEEGNLWVGNSSLNHFAYITVTRGEAQKVQILTDDVTDYFELTTKNWYGGPISCTEKVYLVQKMREEKRASLPVTCVSEELYQLDLAIEELYDRLLQTELSLDRVSRQKKEAHVEKMVNSTENYYDETASITKYSAIKAELNLQRDELNRELNRLLGMLKPKLTQRDKLIVAERKSPCDQILDEDGNKMYFGLNGQLVALEDKSGNRVLFTDGEESSIKKIVAADGRELILRYSSFNKLESLTDTAGRITRYTYLDDNGTQLHEILLPEYEKEHHSEAKITFAYTDDKDLADICGPTGLGYRLSYGNKTLTLTEYTAAKSLNTEGIAINGEKIDGERTEICFTDMGMTTVTDSCKTLYCHFDTAGQLTSCYEQYHGEQGMRNPTAVYRTKNTTYTVNSDMSKQNYMAYTNYTDGWNRSAGVFDCGDHAVINGQHTQRRCLYRIVNTLPTDKHHFLLSLRAKASSAQIVTNRVTGYEDETSYDSHINIDLFNELVNRTFGLRAIVTYADGATENFSADFDWYNTGWQLCCLPISLDKKKQVSAIRAIFVYDYNINKAEICDFRLTAEEGTEEIFSEDRKLLRRTDEYSIDEYTYDGTPNPTSICHTDRKNEQVTVYRYGYDSRNRLLWSEDAKGMLTRKTYNEQGQVIKSVTHHISDPASKLYTESVYNDRGLEIESADPRGQVNGVRLSTKTEYHEGTDMPERITAPNGAVTAYGHHHLTDDLLTLTGDAEGIEHTNRMRYTAGTLTALDNPAGMCYNYTYDGFGRLTAVAVNGQVCATYAYGEEKDADGKLIRKTDTVTLVGGEVFTTVTDACGRAATAAWNGTLLKQFEAYDANDRCVRYTEFPNGAAPKSHVLTFADDVDTHTAGDVTYEAHKDAYRRVVEKTYTVGAEMAQKYDYTYEGKQDGKLLGMRWKDALAQDYTYDALERTVGISTNGGLLRRRVQYLKYNDHATHTVAALTHTVRNGMPYTERYGYNAAGHVENITGNGIEKVRFTYDSLDRLVREDNRELGLTTVFLYDDGGNLLCQRDYEYGLDDEADLLFRREVIYTYGDPDRPDQLTSFNGEKIEYNVNGMPTNYRGNTCTYTRGTLLASMGENTFEYDADGLRTRKNDTVYTYLNKKLLREVGPNDTIDFIYGAEGIMGINRGGNVYLFQKNVLGDVTHIYDTEGNLKARYIYDAWGNHRVFNGDGVDITESNDMNEIGLVNPIRYRSYYYDVETGLYYLRARYYDPETGRFISQDDTQFIDSQHLMGLHLYVYCQNNPVAMRDSAGTVPTIVGPAWIKNLWENSKKIINRVEEKFSQINLTYSRGIGFNVSVFCLSFGAQGGMSIDAKGNIAPQFTLSGGTTSSSGFGISVVSYQTTTNAPDIHKLAGPGGQIGGSITVPIEGVPVVFGGDINVIPDFDNSDTYLGYTKVAGVSLMPGDIDGELHTTVGYTFEPFDSINLFDIFHKFFR